MNTAIFSLVHALILRPLPYGEIDRLVEVVETDPNNSVNAVSYSTFVEWQNAARSLESLAIQEDHWFAVTGRGSPIEVVGARVSTNFFSVLKAVPLVGTTFDYRTGMTSTTPVAI